MKDILSEIIAHKQIEIARQKQAVSIEHLQKTVDAMIQEEADAQPTDRIQRRSMKRALATSASGIIAEFKRQRLD